ncbi:hypothetical protein [Dactylosporangium sp. NPDC051541]|uniref:hypothetical protein n=1 Tax=Dactylosporangium sp. NPDC051541 TaxID=3363977 RepID=UPI0037B22E21
MDGPAAAAVPPNSTKATAPSTARAARGGVAGSAPLPRTSSSVPSSSVARVSATPSSTAKTAARMVAMPPISQANICSARPGSGSSP